RENGIYEREELTTTKSHPQKLTLKKKEVLKFTIGHYLQQNYESLLHAPSSTDHSKSKLTLTVDKVAQKYNEKMTFLDCLNELVFLFVLFFQEKEQLKELTEDYLKYACEVCWLMILQDVTMSLTPTEFQPKETVIFDDKLHIRYYGSENVPHVSYFVWPAVKRGDALFDTLPFVRIKFFFFALGNDFKFICYDSTKQKKITELCAHWKLKKKILLDRKFSLQKFFEISIDYYYKTKK
ncbi:hypothetical protein RFI_13671, partial [Reticulomyxa filosa]